MQAFYTDSQIFLLLVIIFSLLFGSFGSLLSYRMARKQPIVFTRSKCINCGVNLKIYNLIPLFSWIFQRGRCSNCKAKISIRYPLIELAFLLSFLVVYYALNAEPSVKMLLYFLVASTLIIMVVVDLEEYFIPDYTQYFLAILAAAIVYLDGGNAAILPHAKSAFVYLGFGLLLWAFFYFTAGLEAIGIDDLKFFFVVGFMLGLSNFLTFMLLSGVFGMLFGSIWQKVTKQETFPFAPAICMSAFLCLLFGKKLDLIGFVGSMIF